MKCPISTNSMLLASRAASCGRLHLRIHLCTILLCIHSTTQGVLTFEGDATFVRNFVRTDDSVEQGKGGALSNTGSGSILFKGKLTVNENEADVSFEGRALHLARSPWGYVTLLLLPPRCLIPPTMQYVFISREMLTLDNRRINN